MITLRHNELKAGDLVIIERLTLRISQSAYMSLWNESLLDKSEIEVLSYMAGLFKKVGICQKLNISASELLDFLIDVKNSYLDNPYHSFRHGVDVAMVLYYMMQHCHLSQYLNPYYTLILMMAGLCHDAGHPGNNNQFEINCQTERAKKYNNLSVLESHSVSITLELLDKHQLLRHLDSPQHFKQVLSKTILSTDMLCHWKLQENIDILRKNQSDTLKCTVKPLFEPHTDPFVYFNQDTIPSDDTLQMLCNILLHAADISNPCRPLQLAHRFSNLVCIEFFQQGEKERALGLPITFSTERSPSDINLSFIDVIVQPYFESLSKLFPNINKLLQQCKENRALWTTTTTTTTRKTNVAILKRSIYPVS